MLFSPRLRSGKSFLCPSRRFAFLAIALRSVLPVCKRYHFSDFSRFRGMIAPRSCARQVDGGVCTSIYVKRICLQQPGLQSASKSSQSYAAASEMRILLPHMQKVNVVCAQQTSLELWRGRGCLSKRTARIKSPSYPPAGIFAFAIDQVRRSARFAFRKSAGAASDCEKSGAAGFRTNPRVPCGDRSYFPNSRYEKPTLNPLGVKPWLGSPEIPGAEGQSWYSYSARRATRWERR